MTTGEQVRSPGFCAYLQTAASFGGSGIGLVPAIEAPCPRPAALERRRVSLRWLAGILLTGLSGAGLIGVAIYAALGRQTYFAEAPALAVA